VYLQPLTILVGRNSAGKSNFLDAIAFMRDVLNSGTDEAVRLHGGRKAILPRSGQDSTVTLGIEASFQDSMSLGTFTADYDISIKLPDRASPFVSHERLRLTANHASESIGFERTDQQVVWPAPLDAGLLAKFDWCPADRLMLGLYSHFLLSDLRQRLQFTGFYNFSPEAIRELQQPSPGTILERSGRNLPSVIEEIGNSRDDVFRRIQAYLSSIVEEIEGFKVVHYGDYETIQFSLRSNKGTPVVLDATSMSDGTLRALASLAAVFQVRIPPGPSIVGIEEPETALHPAALKSLVDALNEATEKTQVILTTHSADLLADRSLDASQVLVVRNREGQTRITPVDEASREIIERELYSLADLQRQDLLDVDEADLRRQDSERPENRGS
jgi:predicted ATPase